MDTEQSKKAFSITVGILLLIGILGYGGYRFWELNFINQSLKAKLAGSELRLSITDKNLSLVEKEKSDLTEALLNEQSKNTLFEGQISGLSGMVGQLSGTVGVLKKLSQTDPELLKKYSKVYFLSEHYIPSKLGVIPDEYLYKKGELEQIHADALSFFKKMMESAKQDSITLEVVSAYRSFGDQASVKTGYKVTYGAGSANQFSADQGYSEHQLGTAIDFTTPELKVPLSGFSKTTAYKWLEENAYRFGYVISYPLTNSYYQFEPWHWRFVGVALATKLHDNNEYLYDMPQRDIDQHLVNIFD
ncbi:MAG: M15 family metallopeptidase [Patescibacteria group bacterium]